MLSILTDLQISPVVSRLLLALLAGCIIGLERTFHGRPAGLRTHALVCMSSTMLMLLTVYQWDLLSNMPFDTIRTDPTRMAQGVMTGIGFLGAGVIMKEKLTIRGLTTAASIWMTAAIGIVIGMGFMEPALWATTLTLIVLSVLGWSERRLPSSRYARLEINFLNNKVMSKQDLYDMISNYGIKGHIPGYAVDRDMDTFQYELTISTSKANNFHELARALSHLPAVKSFTLDIIGD